jgi:hypothetical protein
MKVQFMNRNKKIDSRCSDNKAGLPSSPAHDPIEPDPMNPKREESPDSESKTARRPDLDWAGEHED